MLQVAQRNRDLCRTRRRFGELVNMDARAKWLLPAVALWAAAPAHAQEPGAAEILDIAPEAEARTVAAADDISCEAAIALAADTHGVPHELLAAIGFVESGYTPWAINAAGTPYFFDSKADAIAKVVELQSLGMESIDVGCMQVNLRWHPDAFADLDEAFNPVTNADYAARFLKSLRDGTSAWEDAVGYYHSSAQVYQEPYVCAVAATLAAANAGFTLPCENGGGGVSTATVAATAPPPPPTSGPARVVNISPARTNGTSVVRGDGGGSQGVVVSGGGGNGGGNGPRIVNVR